MIVLCVLAALTAFVAAPLYRPRAAEPADERGALRARRDVLVAELRELELDRASGALEASEYERSRAAAEAEAAELFRALDAEGSD